ncbi:MAG: lactonase family protein [Verrucomicrobiota bacterium]
MKVLTGAFSFALAMWGLAAAETIQVYVAGGGGIHLLEFDSESGGLTPQGLAAELERPSFLAVHPNGWFLYATNNDGDREAKTSSHAVSFFIEPGSGKLHQLNEVETGGPTSAYIELDARGQLAMVANYRGKSIATFRIGADGKLSDRTQLMEHDGSSVSSPRQDEPHPHAIRIAPNQRFAYAPDLGTDEVFIYQIDHKEAKLVPALEPVAKVDEGSGPRHFDFHPQLPAAYLINEMASTITFFRASEESGSLTAVQTISSLPANYEGRNSTAAIRVHPSGKFVYGSNRGHNSIVVMAADEKGFLKLVEHESTRGETPRHFAIHPDGKWLIAGNQRSGNLAVFEIDQETGALSPKGDLIEVASPSCIIFARQK